jgi:hypothetical protein
VAGNHRICASPLLRVRPFHRCSTLKPAVSRNVPGGTYNVPGGTYEVIKVLPDPDGEREYRIKSANETAASLDRYPPPTATRTPAITKARDGGSVNTMGAAVSESVLRRTRVPREVLLTGLLFFQPAF